MKIKKTTNGFALHVSAQEMALLGLGMIDQHMGNDEAEQAALELGHALIDAQGGTDVAFSLLPDEPEDVAADRIRRQRGLSPYRR